MTNEEIKATEYANILIGLSTHLNLTRARTLFIAAMREAKAEAYEDAATEADQRTTEGLDEQLAKQSERMAAEGGIPMWEAVPSGIAARHKTAKEIAASIRALKDSLTTEAVK